MGQAAAGGGAFDVEGRPAAGLAYGAAGSGAAARQAVHQAYGAGGLALAQRCGRNGADVDVFTGGFAGEPPQNQLLVYLGQLAPHRYYFLGQQAEFSGQPVYAKHMVFGGLGDLPVGHRCGVQLRFLHGYSS